MKQPKASFCSILLLLVVTLLTVSHSCGLDVDIEEMPSLLRRGAGMRRNGTMARDCSGAMNMTACLERRERRRMRRGRGHRGMGRRNGTRGMRRGNNTRGMRPGRRGRGNRRGHRNRGMRRRNGMGGRRRGRGRGAGRRRRGGRGSRAMRRSSGMSKS